MARPVYAPKKPQALRWTAIVAVASFVAFVAWAWWLPWRPGRLGGLVFGTLASLLFLNASLYPARRRLKAKPWRTAQQWLQFHIYGSVIATWFVFLHVGFAFPAGQMGWWLWGLSIWTTLSGIAGVAIQKWLPAAMVGGLHVEAIYERIPFVVSSLAAKADDLLSGAPDALNKVYAQNLRPMLAAPRLSWSYVFNVRAEQDRQLAELRSLSRYVTEADRTRIDALESVVQEKLELDAHASLQRLLRTWLVIHVPPAMLLMALVAVHVIAVLVF